MSALVILASLALSLQLPARVYQPSTYSSSSGTCVLSVEPSHRDGDGPMHCRMLHDKSEVWSADFPWTLDEAGVAEDGTVVAYANGNRSRTIGDVVRIVVLDPKGGVRMQHDLPHTRHDRPMPSATGSVLVHSAAGVAFVGLIQTDHDLSAAPWKVLRLATGEILRELTPPEPVPNPDHHSMYLRGARAVGDTGLTLCQWSLIEYPHDAPLPRKAGVVFALIDLTGSTVWTLPLLDDFTDATGDLEMRLIRSKVDGEGAILTAGPDARFALHHVRAQLRVEYSVEKDASAEFGWRVVELSRHGFSDGVAKPDEPDTLKLEASSTISLLAPRTDAQSPIHDVLDWDFSEAGHIELFRKEDDAHLSFVRLNADGQLIDATDVSELVLEPRAFPRPFRLTGDRWLMSYSNGEPPWLEVDIRNGKSKIAPLPAGDESSTIAPLADGGYVALVTGHEKYRLFSELAYVRTEGSVAWRVHSPGAPGDDDLIVRMVDLARGVAAVSAHMVSVLANNSLVTIDLEQADVLDVFDLGLALGEMTGLLASIRGDHHGGVLLHDDHFWRIDARGAAGEPFRPQRADGSRDAVMDALVRVAPDGRVWTSDRERIYRLDRTGVADLTLGSAPNASELTSASGVEVDHLGRILVQDEHARALHVFDYDGKKLCVCKVDGGDGGERFRGPLVHVLRDGTICVATTDGIVRFDTQGSRFPGKPLVPDAAWSSRFRDLERDWQRMDAEEPALAGLGSIDRRPDGRFLVSVQDRAILPDGRRVIVETPEQADAANLLHFYTQRNEPIGSIELTDLHGWCRLSVSSRWIVLTERRNMLIRLADQKIFRLDLGLADPRSWSLGLSPDGNMLIAVQGEQLELRTYALP